MPKKLLPLSLLLLLNVACSTTRPGVKVSKKKPPRSCKKLAVVGWVGDHQDSKRDVRLALRKKARKWRGNRLHVYLVSPGQYHVKAAGNGAVYRCPNRV